jgi:glutamyl-tRNA reductase
VSILLVGLNHRTAPVELREQVYFDENCIYPTLNALLEQVTTATEMVVVSTCNRVEVYAVVQDVLRAEHDIMTYLSSHAQADDLRTHLYTKQDRHAVTHLLRVACGLDSMILGEAQILGQVGTALQTARQARTCGSTLDRLFTSALHTGKRARTETTIDQRSISVSHAAAQCVGANQDVLLIGAGEMAVLAAHALDDSGVADFRIVNRTTKHAEKLATQVNARAYGWSELWSLLATVDVAITATGAPHTILQTSDLANVMRVREGRPLTLIDVAVPRDIEHTANEIAGVLCYDIDDLKQVVDENLSSRQACIPQVEAIICAEEQKYHQWLKSRAITPLIIDLRRKVRDVAQLETQLALNRLSHLDKDDQAIINQMVHRIVNKVLHPPTANLRQRAATEELDGYARIVRELFDLEQKEDITHV